MNEIITKEDLRQFSLELLNSIKILIIQKTEAQNQVEEQEWIKSKQVRKLMDMSPGSVQNLRVTQKVRFKKVLGSYYYNKVDLLKLFTDELHK